MWGRGSTGSWGELPETLTQLKEKAGTPRSRKLPQLWLLQCVTG